MKRLDHYFERYQPYAAIFIRAILSWRLIYGTQDNILSWERMLEFRDFLDERGVAFPLLGACLSVYVQFFSGLLYLAGAFVRLAALLMVLNFIAALLIAHVGDTFLGAFDALVLLFGSLFLLFYGAGKWSVDDYRLNR